MKFNHKILLLPLLTAVAFALIFVMMTRAAREGERTLGRVQDELFHALELSHRLQVDVMTIRHRLTNAITAGDDSEVEEAERLAERVRVNLADCAGVPLLATRLDTLHVTFDEYWELALATTRDLLRRDRELDLDFSAELYAQVALMNNRYEELRLDLAHIVSTSNEAMDAAMEDTRGNMGRTRRRMNVLSLVFLAVLVFMSLGAIGAIIRPVHRMGKVAQAIAGGDLHQKLEFRSRDALGELADSFRDMQAALIDDIERREKAETELIAAQGQIIQSEKMAALGKLVAGLAHEMNTPLGALTSAADTVDRSRRIVTDSCASAADPAALRADPRFARALTAMERGVANLGEAAARIDELVAGLRAFSQLDQAEYQQTDVNAGVVATLTVLAHEVPAGVALRTELGEVPSIRGFPAQLNQLLLNLLRHALRDTTPPGEITIATVACADGVELTVRDTGHGYDAAALRALFDPSFKADSSRVRLDWGLVACAGIAERHGGSIDAASEPGVGTLFTVRLPGQAPTAAV